MFQSNSARFFIPFAAAAFFPFSASALDGPLTPEEAIRTFQLEPGLKIECVAAEPLVIDPVAVAWDETGKMFVVEDSGYPTGPGKGNPPVGKVVVLEDTNHDGKYDKRTVFADGLTFPNGVLPWKGGVYVTCAPNLFFFKDTNGDGVADEKKIVFSGFQDLSTTQLRVSHPTFNIDNWIYLNSGLTASKVVSRDCTNREPLVLNRLDFRFRPETCDYEEFSGTGQFGGTFDRFGRRFICSNRNHNQHVVMQGRYLRRNPNFSFSEFVQDTPDHGAASRVFPVSHNITTAASHAGFFTSACGVTIFTGTELPFDYTGNAFTCEPAGNLVHRDILEANGATFLAKRAFPTNEFIASPDNWFRPVNLANGPDGALYLCDMYRKTIEHPDYLPEAMRATTDFQSGKDKGRIYRISAVNSQPKKLNWATRSTAQLCEELKNPIGWWRLAAQRLLIEKKDSAALPVLKKLAQKAPLPETRIHALRILEAFNALEEVQILKALSDKAAPVREQALQLAEPLLKNSAALQKAAVALADDSDARVRFQCALALGEIHDEKIIPALVGIAQHNESDRWTRAAILSSIGNFPEKFLEQITQSKNLDAKTDSMIPLLADLGRSLGNDRSQPALSILRMMTRSEDPKDFAWELALLSGYAEGLRASRGDGSPEFSPLMSLVVLNSSMTPFRVQKLMKEAARIAAKNSEPLERRLVAVGLLGNADYKMAGPELQKLIDPQQPTEIQIAAVRALAQMPDAAALVQREHWNAYTQPVKDTVLAAMMARPQLLDALLTAIEKGDIAPTSITPEKRNLLMRNKDATLAKRAAALFKDLKPGDRLKVYEEYKSVLALKPNSQNGHRIFSSTCTPCHTFSGEGHLVGPDLTGIRNQPADVLLLHIIVPEYEIMPIFAQYNVEAKDGRTFAGILASETPASITLKQALGVEETIPRTNIASMTSSTLSLMPQELEKTMSKQDLADLIGFLKGQ